MQNPKEFYSFSMALMKSNENKRIQLYASGNKKNDNFMPWKYIFKAVSMDQQQI